MMLNTAPVAVFDSGIGGIGVLRELQRVLPDENFLYFGDCANAPYGERTTEEIRELVLARAERLFCRTKALVLACNTATAVAAAALRRHYREPVIGMEPALRPALSAAPCPRVLVLATAATLREEKFAALLASARGRAKVTALAAPGLVRLAERGITAGDEVQSYLRALFAPFCGRRFDAVVLGCTHFPFFRAELARALGYPVPLFDGAAGTARETVRRLAAAQLLRPREGELAGCAAGADRANGRRFCGNTSLAGISCPQMWATGRVLLTSSSEEKLSLMQRLLAANESLL